MEKIIVNSENDFSKAQKVSLEQQIESASARCSISPSVMDSQSKEAAANFFQVPLTKDELALIKESLDVMGDRLADRAGYSSGEKYWDLKEKLEGIESKSLNQPSLEH